VLCARLQQLFLERPAAARLVHQQARACPLIKGRLARPPCRCPSASGRAQGYELALVPLVAARVPAARLAAPCLPELLAAPEPSDALFGVVLAAQLAVQHPGPATRVRSALRPALRWLMYGRTALHSDHRHGGGTGGRRRGAAARVRGGRGGRRPLCAGGPGRAGCCRRGRAGACCGRGGLVPGGKSPLCGATPLRCRAPHAAHSPAASLAGGPHRAPWGERLRRQPGLEPGARAAAQRFRRRNAAV